VSFRGEFATMLVLSTAHITQETAEAMEARDLPFTCFANEYGFVVSAKNFETETFKPSIPEDLAKVQEYALANGCTYIMLDRDAPQVDGLPVFDW
jgi:hypothetical protein